MKSERDEQPFVIRYGVNGGLGSKDAVVFEKVAVDGLRQVGFTNGPVEEMAAAEYEQHLQGKAAQSTASAQTTSGA
jgi:hypothetical protein